MMVMAIGAIEGQLLRRTQADMRDAGRRPSAAGAERLCAATREVKPVAEMIRFVIGPDDAVVPDVKRRLPGRGIWVTATRQALRTAIARKAFARGFKRDIRAGIDLIAATERLLERAALDALAMSHKAGCVAIGFAEVTAVLKHDRLEALVHATEAAPEGCRKLAAVLRRRQDAAAIAVIEAFSSAQLDLALGRSNVIHAALLAGPESDTFLARTARLECFRAGPKSDGEGDGPEHQAGLG
jgi:predicted RNA-binding protein YlxR (DUF448 family)